MNRKTVLRVVAIVLVVAVSVAIAVIYRQVSEARQFVAALEQHKVLLERADAAYRADATASSVDALSQYLEYLEAASPSTDPWRPPSHPLLDARGLAVDRTLAAARFAMLQERLGNLDAATPLWLRAEGHAKSGGLAAADQASIRTLVLRLDANAQPGTRPRGDAR